MSTYEKVATVIIVVLLVFMIIFSYREIKEPERGGPNTGPNFNQSLGQNFVIGPYATIASKQSQGGLEDNCDLLQPVIIGALHDIKERLEHQKIYIGVEDAFEVNGETLQLLCNKTAQITLTDTKGDKLILEKMPFTRAVPPQGTAADIGTEVRINATVVPVSTLAPSQPTTFGDVLIPDRFLDAASSTSQ